MRMVQLRNPEQNEAQPAGQDKVLEYFRQIRDLSEEVTAMNQLLQDLKSRTNDLPSPSANMGARVQVSQIDSAHYESAVDRKQDLEAELRERAGLLESLKDQAKRIIQEQCRGKDRMILMLHFIQGATWVETANACFYTERHVYRLSRELLSRITLPEDAIWVY
ncbi:MAG: hypothetical protein IKD50_04940 [Clostridia bacterium]|nr:hypothetical protein [Clostridia bacterium]